MRNFMTKFSNKFGRLQAALAVALVAPFAAMATTPAVDTSSITAELDTYKVAVVALVIAFAVVLWAIRAAGLLRPKG